ncbi:MAG: VWA domain-containing protein [Bacteroidales bacterium]|nr:VWA domain-containing protein [Bacteroidales bacterium]
MFVSATAQEYWIEGFYERHAEGDYTLKDVHTKGITIDGKMEFPNKIFRGTKENIKCGSLDATLIKFSFEKVGVPCESWENLTFQYWDEDNFKWKGDVEACKGKSRGYTQNDIVMMLVLDYSSSMTHDIARMKTMTIEFVNSISRVSSGNVHVGIIAFAGMDKAKSQVFPITPIDANNAYKFESFIRSSSMGTETALYFSMDKAMQMIEEYVAVKKLNPQKYNGTYMITLTDGLDNASINDNISKRMQRGSKNEYLAYLSPRLQWNGTTILGKPLEHFAVGFSGSEEFSAEDLKLFEDVLRRTTPDRDHFKLSNNFEEVEKFFQQIIRNLTQRWQTLDVYIGEAQYGKVRWVLECEPKKDILPPAPPKTGRSVFLGFNVTFGMPFSVFSRYEYLYQTDRYGNRHLSDQQTYTDFTLGFSVKFGVDFAYPLSDKFALGCYMNIGPSFNFLDDFYAGFDVKVGLLALVGDLNKRPFIIGITPLTGFIMTSGVYLPLELRFGKILSDRFYITGNLNMGVILDIIMVEPSVTLGWHLGNKIKVKK